MKTPTLLSLIAAVSATLAVAAENDPAAKQLQVYPKNLARQHLGANLFVFNPKNQAYVPTEAAAAWLDDDFTTGWPALPGKQHYLLALPQPELISNFSLSSKPSSGTITLFAGDEPAIPGAKTWSPLTGALPLNTVNEKKNATPFTRLAKYVLIETDIADPGPIYSLNVYGDKPASSYSLRKRPQPIDSRAIFGQYINQGTAFNLNGIYAQSHVAAASSTDGFVGWQKAIDDNPESSATIPASTNEPSATIQYGSPQSVSRISVLADSAAKGKLDFFLVNDAPAVAAAPASDSELVKASNTDAPASVTTEAAKTTSLEGKTPTISIVLDGSNSRSSINFPAVQASSLQVRWTPANGSDPLTLRELASFGALSLNDYEVATNPESVAERSSSTSGKESLDPKEIAQGPLDAKDSKNPLAPVALGPTAGRSPYLPGALGFPPNTNFRGLATPGNAPTSGTATTSAAISAVTPANTPVSTP